MQEMWVRSLGQEHPLEEKMATHCNFLAWEIPLTDEWIKMWHICAVEYYPATKKEQNRAISRDMAGPYRVKLSRRKTLYIIARNTVLMNLSAGQE